ncbi:MAG TPA: alpha-2-macroglobulin family protein [Candidatus Eisenbacteria bacterium]|nr:alpha-2-macroglobulin family protein [Candidatus Eisenbacteria bacterium]
MNRGLSAAVVLALMLPLVYPLQAENAQPYFSVTSERTYLPGEKIEIGVYSNHVTALEFRVYRVNEAGKFFSQLQDMHSFGGQAPRLPLQQRTWLERFHAWKHRMWVWIRDFVRAQFSPDSRHRIRLWRMGESAPNKKGPQANEYAQVPVLNQQQLVSTWKWMAPPGDRWESQRVTVPVSDKGVYLLEATNGTLRAYTIVVVTDIAIISKAAPGRLLCYVVDRTTGNPIAGAATRVWIEQQEIASKATDQNGLLDLTITQAKPENVAVLATYQDEVAVNAPGAWNMGAESRNLRGYTYTDRPVYRPGDTVHFKTIVRTETPSGYVIPKDRELRLELRDPRTYQPIWQQTVTLSDLGTGHWDYPIPADANLGFYYLNMQSGERYVEGVRFSVQDYKKPEYAVKVTAQTLRVLQGQPIKATIDARYYFGEPVANARVKWVVHTSTYWPFGRYESDSDNSDDGYDGGESEPGEADTFGTEQESEQSGLLDADGKLQITIPTRVNPKKQDVTYRIEARVTDEGNREISGHGFALATYGSFYLTAEPNSYVYSKGGTAIIKVVAQDYDKKPVATAFRAELSRWNWQKRTGEMISTTQGQTGSDGKGQVQFTIPDAGEFRVRISAMSVQNREVEDTAYLWAPGISPLWAGTQQERIQLVADKKSYAPGEIAHVLIVTGKEPVSVLVTGEGNGLYSWQVVKSAGGSVTVDVPVEPEFAPNFYVTAAFIRDNKFYSGSKSLKVPPTQHELNVELKPSKPQYQPGQAGAYTVKATDSAGKPVAGADFSLGVVDEAIYAIQPETVGGILSAFYGTVYSKVSTDSSLSYYFSGQAGKRALPLANVGPSRGLAQLKPERLVQPKIRKAFPDTAYWVADVRTDSSGQATVKFEYPDAITSWRATTRGVTQDTKVGSAVENTIVRKNLMVRLVAPRFFRRGDEIVLSTIVQNYLPEQKTARVSMEFTGLQVMDGAMRDVPVPSRGTVKVDYRVRVLDVDAAKVLGKALTDVESDAMELTLPVVPFGVQFAVAKSGSINGSSSTSEQVVFPTGIEPNTGRLTMEVTPSIAGTIFGALDFLTSYPYGCTEQTMSSFLPDVLVADAVKKLDVGTNINPQTLNKQVQAGLDRLYQYQHPDGGWGWWQTDDSQPFMTAYVLAGLVQAKAAGYEVEDARIYRARKWLLPEFNRSTAVKTDLRAYMAYALVLSGSDSDTAIVDSVWNQRATLTSYGKALLGLATMQINDPRANDLAKQLASDAKQDESQAWWPTDTNNLMDFYGDTTPQATAYALKLLDRVDPQSPLLPKAALWLVSHRGQGYYWDSTQQTAMVIYGLTDYLQRTQELKPNFSVDVQVNGKTVATKKFGAADATAPPAMVTLAEAQLAQGANQIRLVKSGAGRLYWSARGEYYSSQPNAVNTGSFQLSTVRAYYRLTPRQAGDKLVYHLDPLSGPVQVGDTLAVRITVGGSDWRYLMIEDPIPSGTESIARDDLYQLDEKPDWWRRPWAYRELRDDRTTFFNYWFPRGQAEYTYLLKVVNPGVFRVSPTRVEPMYQPQYLSTSDALTVTVK